MMGKSCPRTKIGSNIFEEIQGAGFGIEGEPFGVQEGTGQPGLQSPKAPSSGEFVKTGKPTRNRRVCQGVLI